MRTLRNRLGALSGVRGECGDKLARDWDGAARGCEERHRKIYRTGQMMKSSQKPTFSSLWGKALE